MIIVPSNVPAAPVKASVGSSANWSAASTITIPPHKAGDLILVFAFNTMGTTIPGMPAVAGTVPAFTSIRTYATRRPGARAAYALATASNHTSGTWSNAGAMGCVVISGQGSTPIGGNTVTSTLRTTPTTPFTIPAVTMAQTDGTSALIQSWCAGENIYVGTISVPAGYTVKSTLPSGIDGGISLKNDTTTDGAAQFVGTATVVAGTEYVTAFQVEIVAAAALRDIANSRLDSAVESLDDNAHATTGGVSAFENVGTLEAEPS